MEDFVHTCSTKVNTIYIQYLRSFCVALFYFLVMLSFVWFYFVCFGLFGYH
jgi:hypothetical protein